MMIKILFLFLFVSVVCAITPLNNCTLCMSLVRMAQVERYYFADGLSYDNYITADPSQNVFVNICQSPYYLNYGSTPDCLDQVLLYNTTFAFLTFNVSSVPVSPILVCQNVTLC